MEYINNFFNPDTYTSDLRESIAGAQRRIAALTSERVELQREVAEHTATTDAAINDAMARREQQALPRIAVYDELSYGSIIYDQAAEAVGRMTRVLDYVAGRDAHNYAFRSKQLMSLGMNVDALRAAVIAPSAARPASAASLRTALDAISLDVPPLPYDSALTVQQRASLARTAPPALPVEAARHAELAPFDAVGAATAQSGGTLPAPADIADQLAVLRAAVAAHHLDVGAYVSGRRVDAASLLDWVRLRAPRGRATEGTDAKLRSADADVDAARELAHVEAAVRAKQWAAAAQAVEGLWAAVAPSMRAFPDVAANAPLVAAMVRVRDAADVRNAAETAVEFGADLLQLERLEATKPLFT